MNEFTPNERKKFLLISYMDQVYPYQKQQYIDMLNLYFDGVIAFTPYWRSIVRLLGLKKDKPCFVFPHGFDHELYYPIPRKFARVFFDIPEDAYAILNLNRNQPRKRWDQTIIAFADVVQRYYEYTKEHPTQKMRPIRLVVGTTMDGPWDLTEIYKHELRIRNVPYEFAEKFIVALPNPQQLSDRDINVLYNACDVGLNTCEGEGFGLCQIEHLAVGAPQVCPKIGGLQEFLTSQNSSPIEARLKYYIEKNRDGIGGIAEMGDPIEYADALWKYYMDPTLCEKHAKQGRIDILTHYRWENMVEYFYHLIKHISKNVKKI
jgi:glycosyltransferase involved in cell wall biosynthesis